MQVQTVPARPNTPRVTGALRVVESFLLRGGQRTARSNAWSAVLEDRRRAMDRREVQLVVEKATGTAPARRSAPGAPPLSV